MQKGPHFSQRRLTAGIGSSLLLAFILVMAIIQVIFAEPSVANLEGSTKEVSSSQVLLGQTLRYTVVISNSGDTAVPNVMITDTLPISLTYSPGSLTYTVDHAAATSFGESSGTISWTGVISEQGSTTLYYQAVLTDTLQAGDIITNTVYITGTGNLITRTAATTVISSASMLFPVIFQAVPAPNLQAVVRTSSTNLWTVSWDEPSPAITGYEIQEDSDSNFNSPTTFDVGTDLSRDFSHTASTNHLYCYRVRAAVNSILSPWSNTECVYGNYFDDFSSSSSGWSIRRQDTDDVDNESYYEDGNFITKIRGRWDYAIASPLEVIPWSSYQIRMRALLGDGVDNLHSYGIIFGGDWNGTTCPNNDYSSCFNHYYRLNIIYFGDNASALRIQLKRIDYHDMKDGNAGRGESLVGFKDVPVNDPSGWNTWKVTVEADGTIEVFVNDNLVASAQDTKYIHEPYFGVFASSDEYSGTAATFDYYQVKFLP